MFPSAPSHSGTNSRGIEGEEKPSSISTTKSNQGNHRSNRSIQQHPKSRLQTNERYEASELIEDDFEGMEEEIEEEEEEIGEEDEEDVLEDEDMLEIDEDAGEDIDDASIPGQSDNKK